MNLTFDFDEAGPAIAKLRVVGVGGAGCNALNRMILEGLGGVEFVAINTDEQALSLCHAPIKIKIGNKTTQGLGAGADPEQGRRAVEEDRTQIYDILGDSDLVFITAGMGGGTGTGASPIVAEIARDSRALTVGIVTTPFLFEGPKRIQRAEEGIAALKENVHTLIVVPNQRLLTIVPKSTSLDAGFRYADEILFNATKGISDLITIPGLVNLDFADVKAIMSEHGKALLGCGVASGENKAVEAAEMAIHSPLLEDVSITGAKGLLVNITGGPEMGLHEVNEAASIISEEAGSRANLIFGAVIDKSLTDELRITVIATGIAGESMRPRIPGLPRPNFDKKPVSINQREIPAIDRLDSINERVKEAGADSNVFSFSSSSSNNERHQERMRKSQERINRFMRDFNRSAKGGQQNEQNSNAGYQKSVEAEAEEIGGYSDDDLEVPTFLRKRRHIS
ncbi:cell division protein FtsZ [candidate division KSB1 bacterium]|nr:cell division protein FtsZ [candidate division KSB1 bacterium]